MASCRPWASSGYPVTAVHGGGDGGDDGGGENYSHDDAIRFVKGEREMLSLGLGGFQW